MPADEIDYQIAHTIKIDTTPNRRRIYIDGERFWYATQGEIIVEEFKTPSGKIFNNVVWIPVMVGRVELEGSYHVTVVNGKVEFIDNTEEDTDG